MKLTQILIAAAMPLMLPSCAGLISGITKQPVPSSQVKRVTADPAQQAAVTPVNIATADLLQAEVGPKETVFGLYDTGVVARAVGRVEAVGK